MNQTGLWDTSAGRARETTLREARDFLVAGMREGRRCQCCHRWAKLNVLGVTSGMTRSLMWLVRMSPKFADGWVHLPTQAPRDVLTTNSINKWKFWGMVEAKANEDTTKKNSGILRPCGDASDWILGPKLGARLLVRRYRFIFDDQEVTPNHLLQAIQAGGTLGLLGNPLTVPLAKLIELEPKAHEKIDVITALGTKFDYWEMMND